MVRTNLSLFLQIIVAVFGYTLFLIQQARQRPFEDYKCHNTTNETDITDMLNSTELDLDMLMY